MILSELEARTEAQRLTYRRWFPGEVPADRSARLKIEDPALERFCLEGCRTVDEHDPENPLKHLPLDELPYLKLYFRLLLRERLVIVPKSRQIMMTWATFVYVLWRLLRWPHQKWALVPKKKEDGMAHVEERLKDALWDSLPTWLKSLYTISPVKGHFAISHYRGQPWRSSLAVYPQGADQLRQYTHSGIIWDEAAHQPKMQEAWKGAAPTIGGRRGKRGQVILVSSAKKGSFFQKLAGPSEVVEAVRVARKREVAA